MVQFAALQVLQLRSLLISISCLIQALKNTITTEAWLAVIDEVIL